jgi:energy-coupling factor transporter ATP-binding protein EcfA2
MKAIGLRIRNVLGIKELDIAPGEITIFEGRNGSGKTSAMEALKNMVEGGSIMKIRSIDAADDEKSEIVLTLDGEDGTIIAKQDERGTSVKKQVGDTAAFEDVPRPATYLKNLYDTRLANPIKFLECNDKERVQLLLEALPLQYSASDLWSAIGLNETEFPAVPDGLHPLVEIALHRDNIFRERTGVNRDEKQKRATCEQTRRSVPAEIPSVEDIEEKEKRRDSLRMDRQRRFDAAHQAADMDKRKAKTTLTEKEKLSSVELERFSEQVRREAEQRIAAKRDELDAQLSIDRIETANSIELTESTLKEVIEDIDKMIPEIDALSSEISMLKERSLEITRIRERHAMADQFERDADDLKLYSERLTDALKRLDEYKASMCSDMPIPGLDVSGNVVTVNGVPWSQLNTAKRIQIAVQVACLRFGDAKFRPVFIDGAEALDSESMAIMDKQLKSHGAQAFIARVADHDLEIIRNA